MTTAESASGPARVGPLLKYWRSARRLSQLDLALQAEVSARHLSFLESGRSQPSREMLARLADVLDVPLRERNTLLLAAGFAPIYHETDLGTADLALARRAVEFLLKQLEPYPAVAVDRHWNLIRPNEAAGRLLGWLLDGPPLDTNMLRLTFRSDGLRGLIANWEEVAGNMLRRLQLEAAGEPATSAGRRLIAEILAFPGNPDRWYRDDPTTGSLSPLLTVTFRKDGEELRFISTITTFGTPRDITLQELRIESFYPADEATDAHCRHGSLW
jgi:transcriptional regulator with XRE-family HTH domain